MTSPVSAIEAIEKMAREAALEVFANAIDSDDDSHSLDTPVSVAIIRDTFAPLALKAEALQRENAELREELQPFVNDWADEHGWTEAACQKDRIVDWFGPSDFRRARALLGGDNADLV